MPGETGDRPGERGDTLIEVIISALIVGLIVIATLNGIDGANSATALSRARFQADALAQQNEDRLRSEPTQHLAELLSLDSRATSHEEVLAELARFENSVPAQG